MAGSPGQSLILLVSCQIALHCQCLCALGSVSNSQKFELPNPFSSEVGAYIELKAAIKNAFILPSSRLLSSLLLPFWDSVNSWTTFKSSENKLKYSVMFL